ncbi:hypothetical protein F2P81_014414 [Scophthalmus maximus]|uniref:Cilia- and flagella-associated protein 299 n=1 Tax=Scophthalmus maximus TaxID=52904 RepID=A0A6A4SQG1_SCOMX|nr:hypothetical protein F2P81_014414 [Scophthalmus maximus]
MERSAAAAAARFLGSVSQFKVYEDYLDSKVTPVDLFYLKSRDLARKLVEHGHKGTVLSREEFEEKKAAAQAAEAARSNALYNRSRPVFHIKFNLDDSDSDGINGSNSSESASCTNKVFERLEGPFPLNSHQNRFERKQAE